MRRVYVDEQAEAKAVELLNSAAPDLLVACEKALEAFGHEKIDRTQFDDEQAKRFDAIMHLMHASKKARGGFTLIELLVVLVIVGMIAAAVISSGILSPRHAQMRAAADMVGGAIVGARDQAIHDATPAGFRLVPDPVLNGLNPTTGLLDPAMPLAANRIVPLVVPPEHSEGGLSIYDPASYSAAIKTVQTVAGVAVAGVPCLVVEEAVVDGNGLPNAQTGWWWNIRLGDKLQISKAGPYYYVVGPMVQANPEQFVNVGNPGTVSPITRPVTLPGGGIVQTRPEYLLLVNDRDDGAMMRNGGGPTRDGYINSGFDGVDNDGDGTIDNLEEWEQEVWVGQFGF